MPLQFPNFEKCHCNLCKLWKTPLQFANFEKRHSRLRKMPLEMAWNGIFQSLEIAVAFLGYTRFGVAFIKLTQDKNNWASFWSLVSAAGCAILLFIDYVGNGMGPKCQKSTRRSHFFYWLEIRRHLLAYELVSFFRGRHFYSKNCHFASCVANKTARCAFVG